MTATNPTVADQVESFAQPEMIKLAARICDKLGVIDPGAREDLQAVCVHGVGFLAGVGEAKVRPLLGKLIETLLNKTEPAPTPLPESMTA